MMSEAFEPVGNQSTQSHGGVSLSQKMAQCFGSQMVVMVDLQQKHQKKIEAEKKKNEQNCLDTTDEEDG